MTDDLRKRVDQFNALELPGQPPMMHMGTSHLVNDLWRELARLRGMLGVEHVAAGVVDWRAEVERLNRHNNQLRDRVRDAETGLSAWDEHRESEYWLRWKKGEG